jgi:DNA invertase Pin-like site-specific DNA recombinase
MVVKHSTNGGRLRAVAYYRMSTAQQAASIPEQREWAHRAAAAKGFDLVAEFQDDGIPGSEIERRPGLMRLLAYCEAEARAGRPVDDVICWDADRFSRASSLRTAGIICRLLDAGVTRMFTAEGWIDWEDDTDLLVFNVKQDAGKAAYSKSLSKNVTRSAVERARLGLWVAGRPPYGYRIGDDGHLALGDPALVETVRWIFRQYATTADSCGDLCRRLIETGAPPPPSRMRRKWNGREEEQARPWGGRWQRSILNNLLACRAYLGEISWNVQAQGKYSRVEGGEVKPVKGRAGRRRLVRNAPEDWIVTPNAHPAIIDPGTFDACQRKLAETCRGGSRCRNTPLPGGGDWVLSGLLYCGVCGGRMVGVTERRRYKDKPLVYRYYACKTNQRLSAGTCRKNAVKQEAVVREVARLIQQSFTDPERLALLRAEVERQAGQDEEDRAADRQRLRAALDSLDGQIAQGNRNLAVLPEDRLAGVVAQVRAWEAERAELARELARLDAAAEVQADYARHVAAALEQVRHLEETIRTAPPDAVRNALAGLVERITLYFDYGPAYRDGKRPAILTSLEIQMREEAAGLLGEKLTQSARSTA